MSGLPVPEARTPEEIKQVPGEAETRERIRGAAVALARDLPRDSAPARAQLIDLGRSTLSRLDLPERYLGFAMVAVSNAFWRTQFEGVPFYRRLLLLPQCLRDTVRCRATIDSVGLHCDGCRACVIAPLLERARALGYETIVAEGTSSVIMKVVEGEADAILGVGCLDSLDESFEPISDLGVPNQAVPLLADGCVDTATETELLLTLLTATRKVADAPTRSAVPLLRATRGTFERDALDPILVSHVTDGALSEHALDDPLLATEAIGIDWLRGGGKRLRPFVTLAAHALGRHGMDALAPDFAAEEVIDGPVRALAVAIEALHKASLVHDDIADGDEFRYGMPTLHCRYGVGPAVNVGDWLVGLGYRLVSAQAEALGSSCVADILNRLSASMLSLCRGQGAELTRISRERDLMRPVDALKIGALKTAPAFEVALYAGLRSCDAGIDHDLIRRFSLYLGEAYQVLNDLDDWHADDANKIRLGRDVLTARPTILRAFAIEQGGAEALLRLSGEDDPEKLVRTACLLYDETGAFARADALVDGLRARCLELADEARPEALGELLRFLTRAVLRRPRGGRLAKATSR